MDIAWRRSLGMFARGHRSRTSGLAVTCNTWRLSWKDAGYWTVLWAGELVRCACENDGAWGIESRLVGDSVSRRARADGSNRPGRVMPYPCRRTLPPSSPCCEQTRNG